MGTIFHRPWTWSCPLIDQSLLGFLVSCVVALPNHSWWLVQVSYHFIFPLLKSQNAIGLYTFVLIISYLCVTVASYIALLVGVILQHSPDYTDQIKQHLTDSSFTELISVLQKFLDFMKVADAASGSSGSKSIATVINYLKEYTWADFLHLKWADYCSMREWIYVHCVSGLLHIVWMDN